MAKVDRLGYVDDADGAAGVAFEAHRGKGGVVPSDGDELGHVEPQQRVDGLLEERRRGRRIGAGDAQMRSTAEVDPADGLDRQRGDVLDVPLHQPLEPVANADDVEAFEAGADGRRGNDTVDPGGRSAADKDGEPLVMFHDEVLSLMKSIAGSTIDASRIDRR